jgi:hypothetical protein
MTEHIPWTEEQWRRWFDCARRERLERLGYRWVILDGDEFHRPMSVWLRGEDEIFVEKIYPDTSEEDEKEMERIRKEIYG